ncbi:MAG: 50S ribosomal protein L10 [Phycisphaerales bacterium]|nr:50S ribosomal protein L10 [Phycisphaerales bacterium]
MSREVKGMLSRDYEERLGDTSDALVISLRGISANNNNEIRSKLLKKDIRVTVVRNALFRRAFEGRPLGGLAPVLSGSSAVAYGGETVVDVAREIVGLLKEYPEIELKGAILDGMLFEGEQGVQALSKYPTRDEAIAKDITLVLSPGRNLMGQVKGPGSKVAGLIKAIEEKLEKGETIAS